MATLPPQHPASLSASGKAGSRYRALLRQESQNALLQEQQQLQQQQQQQVHQFHGYGSQRRPSERTHVSSSVSSRSRSPATNSGRQRGRGPRVKRLGSQGSQQQLLSKGSSVRLSRTKSAGSLHRGKLRQSTSSGSFGVRRSKQGSLDYSVYSGSAADVYSVDTGSFGSTDGGAVSYGRPSTTATTALRRQGSQRTLPKKNSTQSLRSRHNASSRTLTEADAATQNARESLARELWLRKTLGERRYNSMRQEQSKVQSKRRLAMERDGHVLNEDDPAFATTASSARITDADMAAAREALDVDSAFNAVRPKTSGSSFGRGDRFFPPNAAVAPLVVQERRDKRVIQALQKKPHQLSEAPEGLAGDPQTTSKPPMSPKSRRRTKQERVMRRRKYKAQSLINEALGMQAPSTPSTTRTGGTSARTSARDTRRRASAGVTGRRRRGVLKVAVGLANKRKSSPEPGSAAKAGSEMGSEGVGEADDAELGGTQGAISMNSVVNLDTPGPGAYDPFESVSDRIPSMAISVRKPHTESPTFKFKGPRTALFGHTTAGPNPDTPAGLYTAEADAKQWSSAKGGKLSAAPRRTEDVFLPGRGAPDTTDITFAYSSSFAAPTDIAKTLETTPIRYAALQEGGKFQRYPDTHMQFASGQGSNGGRMLGPWSYSDGVVSKGATGVKDPKRPSAAFASKTQRFKTKKKKALAGDDWHIGLFSHGGIGMSRSMQFVN